ncbi:MAG TPA: DinB family protein [Blastocatellia bacterium]|nr:DinB family protein [Blastocatellia bacterium]
MANINILADLYRHMEWADAAVWTSVLASEAGETDAKLREYLNHLHAVQRAFLRVWRGEPLDTTYPEFEGAKSLLQWVRTYYGEAFAMLEALNEEKISEPMIMPWAGMVEKRLGHKPDATTLGETLLQVALHSTYHRGQANARLRAVGGKAPMVDYIAWVWMGRPAAAWPDATP